MGKERLTNDPIAQYDSFFEAYDAIKNKKNISKLGEAMAPTFRGYNTGIGKSKYDSNFNWNADANLNDIPDSINEHRANEQSGFGQLGLGFGRAGTKAIAEIAKIPGVIAGTVGGIAGNTSDLITGKDEYDFVENAFNNPWIKAIDGAQKDFNDDILPVYVSKAVREGNLWDNVSSTAFWATDGADGLGFIAGMMVPGALFEYAGLGAKLISSISNSKKLANLVSLSGKAEEGTQIAKLLGMSGKGIDGKLAVLGNTYLESGAEAKGVGDDLDRKKDEFIKKQINDGFTPEQAEESFKNQRALAMRDTFISNVGILLGPNAIMHKAVWGKAGKTYTAVEDNVLKRIVNSSKKVGTAFASEGFWEEGSQSTVENMYTNKALNKELGNGDDFNIGDFTKEYINTVSTTEGQKAIFLGGALGGPMMSISSRIDDNRNRKETNRVLKGINEEITNFNTLFDNDIYQTDDKGNFIYKKDAEGNDTTERILDGKGVSKVAKALNHTELESQLFDLAVQSGNTEVVERLKQKAIFNLITPAIFNGEIGIKALEQKLNEDSKFNEIVEADKTTNNKNKTKTFITETLETAKYLQKQNEKFQSFSKDVIELKNKIATSKQKDEFLNKLNLSYLNTKHTLRQSEKKLKELEEKRDKILEELNINPSLEAKEIIDNGRLLQDYKTKSPVLTNTIDEIINTQKEISESKNDIADLWQGKTTIGKSFDDFVDEDNELAKTTSDENAEKTGDLIDKINEAQTPEELEAHLNSLSDTKLVDKNLEFNKIKELTNSINNDSSLENINNILNELKNSEFNNYSVQKLIKTLENRSNNLLTQQREFKKQLEGIINENAADAQKLVKELKDVESGINELIEAKKELITLLESQPKEIRGRNSKKIKELIKTSQRELKALTEIISNLEERKEEITKKLQKIDKNLEYLFGAIEQTPKSEFRSVSDVLNYLYTNKEDFKEHRFDIERLTLHKYYTEENIKGLETSIDALENYKEVLQQTIRHLLDSQDNHSEDLYYLQEQLNNTNEQLEQSKKDIIKTRQKLEGLNNAILDTNISKLLKNETEFWKNIKNIKKLKPSSYFNNIYVEKLIDEKKEELVEKEKVKDSNEEIKNEEELLREQFKMQYIEDNYDVEDEFVISAALAKFLKIKGVKTGTIATISKIDKNKNLSLKIDNKTFKVDLNTFFETAFNPEFNYGSEGGNENHIEIKKIFDKEEPKFSTNGTKVLSTDENGEPLPFMNEEPFKGFIDFERNPNIVKTGQKVSFEINTKATSDENWRRALSLFNAKDFSDLEFLIKHLPINVVFESGQKAPINTYYESKEGSKTFDSTSKLLRTSILKELEKGSTLESLKTTVEGQYNGELQVEDVVVENKVQDLYQFGGDISNIKSDNIYIVDDKGVLRNTKNVILPTSRQLSPGEIYIQINTARGNKFPLKLNVRKIQPEQAEALYELYKYRFEDLKNKTKALTLGQIEESNPELVTLLKKQLKKEIEVIDKNYKDISIKDLVDILIWD